MIYQGKIKSGEEVVIRYSEIGDVKELLRFINELSNEKTFIAYQGENETIKSETKYLKEKLKSIKDKKSVQLLAFCDSKLVAESEIHMMEKVEKHIGIFGISISQNFRNKGLGTMLTNLVLQEAKKNIPGIKIVILDVYSTNVVARNLYKKIGFLEYGILPSGICRNGKYEDTVFMYKNI